MLTREMASDDEENSSGAEVSSTGMHNDWGVVSVGDSLSELPKPNPNFSKDDQSQEESNEEAGVLILSGSEDDEDEKFEGPKEGKEEEKENSKLSLPASIPSDVGTLGDEDETFEGPKEEKENPKLSLRSSIPSDLGTLGDFPDESDAEKSPSAESEAVVRGDYVTRLREEVWKNKSQLALLGALFCFLMTSYYYYIERNRWRSSALRLEEDIQNLQQELEEARGAYLDWQTNDEQTNIVDNCWLQAKASIHLGPCAQEATDAAKDYSLSLIQKLEEFTNSLGSTAPPVTEEAASEADEDSETSLKEEEEEEVLATLTTRKMFNMLAESLWSNAERQLVENQVEDVGEAAKKDSVKQEVVKEDSTSLMKRLGTVLGNITEEDASQLYEELKASKNPETHFFGVSSDGNMATTEELKESGDYASAVVETVHGISEALVSLMKNTAEATDLNGSFTYILEALDNASNKRKVKP